jgi:hypothetical protein
MESVDQTYCKIEEGIHGEAKFEAPVLMVVKMCSYSLILGYPLKRHRAQFL